MTDIVPAILPESFDDIVEHAARVRGLVGRVQIDIANGSYAPTKTWPYLHDDHLSALVSQDEGFPFWEDLSYEVDMLIREPEAALENWVDAGIIAAIIHIESTDKHAEIIQKTRAANIELGWGIKPSTPNETLFAIIEAHGLPDFVQCMGNDTIGHSGIELDSRVYEKIRDIRSRYPDLTIAVDIGVNEETAPELIAAGATKLVSGSAIFDATNIVETVAALQES
jgi:ribulose-phosphate 3-epimerase